MLHPADRHAYPASKQAIRGTALRPHDTVGRPPPVGQHSYMPAPFLGRALLGQNAPVVRPPHPSTIAAVERAGYPKGGLGCGGKTNHAVTLSGSAAGT